MSNISRKRSSLNNGVNKDEAIDNKRFMNLCQSVYLTVFNDINEEISSSDELILLLQHYGCNPSKKTIEKYWNKDTDSYTFKQFCEIAKQEEKTSKKDLIKAFHKIDINGDGFITHDELIQVLTKNGERMTKAEVKMMIEDADFNGDGKLDYEEFCDMMDSTANMCQQFHTKPQPTKKDGPKPLPRHDRKLQETQTNKASSRNIIKEEKEKRNSIASIMKEDRDKRNSSSRSNTMEEKHQRNFEDNRKIEDGTHNSGSARSSLMKKKSPKQQSQEKEDSRTKESDKTYSTKLKEEPRDLMRWNFQSVKGCFYKEEDGQVESHQFQLKVTQPTTVWISIKPSPPKYGKFNDEILETDMTVLLTEESGGSKLIAFSNSLIEGKSCLQAELDIGVYSLITFSSGAKLLEDESESGQVALVKGTGDEMRLTKSCKDTFMEIFYRCDLDGNGYLNRDEFNEFQLRTSGEDCDDEAWEVVKDNFEMTPQGELTPNGFVNLNLMEARDPQGGPDELWVTLETMGYSKKLQLSMACPFQIEVYTKRMRPQVKLIGVSNGGKPLQSAVVSAVKSISSAKPIKNKRNLMLHTAQFDQRITMAVENESNTIFSVKLDCGDSENMVSHQNTMTVSEEVEPKSTQIFHHLVPKNKTQRMQLNYTETIEK